MTNLNVLNRPRLVDDVVRVLREKIVRGELPAGTQLLQIDLANQLGVSRTPLREAFRILENDGFLKASNNNRTVEVVTFTAAEMRDMYEIREVIDGLAARLAAGRGLSAEAEAEARRLLTTMASTSKPHDPLRRVEAHSAFHSVFLEHSGNGRLTGLIPLIRASSAAVYLPFIDTPEGVQLTVDGKLMTHKQLLDESQDSHKAILDAVLEGKAAKAETAARKHIGRTLALVDRFDEWRKVIAEAAVHQHDHDAAPAPAPNPPSASPARPPPATPDRELKSRGALAAPPLRPPTAGRITSGPGYDRCNSGPTVSVLGVSTPSDGDRWSQDPHPRRFCD